MHWGILQEGKSVPLSPPHPVLDLVLSAHLTPLWAAEAAPVLTTRLGDSVPVGVRESLSVSFSLPPLTWLAAPPRTGFPSPGPPWWQVYFHFYYISRDCPADQAKRRAMEQEFHLLRSWKRHKRHRQSSGLRRAGGLRSEAPRKTERGT